MGNSFKISKLKKAIVVLSVLILLTPLIIALICEDVGTHNPFIVFSKRIVAQMAKAGFSVWDPYKHKIKKAYLGPAQIQKDSGKIYLDDRQGIQEFIDSLPSLKDRLILDRYDNAEIIQGSFKFLYQPAEEPALIVLRGKFNLDQVVKGANTDFEQILKLAIWVNQKWEYGRPKKVPFNFDALEILKRAKEGEQFICSEYATVFLQCALSLGFQARYVGLESHVVTEVWVDELNKWVVIDPTFCVYFQRNSTPLNCLEIHKSLIDNGQQEIKVINFCQEKNSSIDQKKLFRNYKNFYVRMRNDWLTNKFPHWYPLSNSIMNGLKWSDDGAKNLLNVARKTSNPVDLYWTINQTHITLLQEAYSAKEIKFIVFLNTMTPNFSHFEVNINEKKISLTDSLLEWNIKRGRNTIIATAVNMFGKKGKPSLIDFYLKE